MTQKPRIRRFSELTQEDFQKHPGGFWGVFCYEPDGDFGATLRAPNYNCLNTNSNSFVYRSAHEIYAFATHEHMVKCALNGKFPRFDRKDSADDYVLFCPKYRHFATAYWTSATASTIPVHPDLDVQPEKILKNGSPKVVMRLNDFQNRLRPLIQERLGR